MCTALCLVAHIVDDLDTCSLEERLLKLPKTDLFALMTADLSTLEGCYLFYDRVKDLWIRSGKTSGAGEKSTFGGRGQKHIENSKKLEEMKKHPLYRYYPASKVPNLGGIKGYFENLDTYCGMAFDKKSNVELLCSIGQKDSLFVWSDQTMQELRKRGGDLQKLQLEAVAYLWELVYDLLLASSDNVSLSPGFESLGLRLNRLVGAHGGSD